MLEDRLDNLMVPFLAKELAVNDDDSIIQKFKKKDTI